MYAKRVDTPISRRIDDSGKDQCHSTKNNFHTTKMNLHRYTYVIRRKLLLAFILICLIKTFAVLLYDEHDTSKTYLPYSKYTYPLEMDFTSNYEAIGLQEQLAIEIINPHPFSYIHLKQKCHFKEERKTSLLILVKSSASNYHLRQAIRGTWGKLSKMDNIEIVFLLAYHIDLQLDIDKEALLHGDILQESFLDTYLNNTYKIIMGFNWAVEHCDRATHLVFVDDDHYLHIPNLLSYIDNEGISSTDSIMVGNVIINGVPYRDKTSKWYLSFDQYPFDRTPPYLAGAAILLTRETARKMVFVFPYITYMGIDDVWLGIAALKMDIKLRHEPSLILPFYLMYTAPSQILYGEFKHLKEFQIVHNWLQHVSSVKMCAFNWKCQFAFLV
ncbi:beta-1,3-galactosyltransferase brn-like [Argopecten irradians]|uniref:beta-1,3-galactosyltransferase brn-like n=1 Tax=Argopecten irradians TaxID=31199 RepID=UPI0037240B83